MQLSLLVYFMWFSYGLGGEVLGRITRSVAGPDFPDPFVLFSQASRLLEVNPGPKGGL